MAAFLLLGIRGVAAFPFLGMGGCISFFGHGRCGCISVFWLGVENLLDGVAAQGKLLVAEKHPVAEKLPYRGKTFGRRRTSRCQDRKT